MTTQAEENRRAQLTRTQREEARLEAEAQGDGPTAAERAAAKRAAAKKAAAKKKREAEKRGTGESSFDMAVFKSDIDAQIAAATEPGLKARLKARRAAVIANAE